MAKKNKKGDAGNGLGHLYTHWSGGLNGKTVSDNKIERKSKSDKRQKQKGWEA